MSDGSIADLYDRLQPVSQALEADGFRLDLEAVDEDRVRARIVAVGAECEDCLVPKAVMSTLISDALGAEAPQLELLYPADA